MSNKTLSDREILKNVIEALHTNPKRLSEDIGYKSHNSIYNITNDTGTGNITPNLVERIITKFPQVRSEYLYTGEGEILQKETQNQQNMFYQHKSLDRLLEIPDLLEKQNSLLSELVEMFKNK
jgi:hypothetical protein